MDKKWTIITLNPLKIKDENFYVESHIEKIANSNIFGQKVHDFWIISGQSLDDL